MKSLRSYIKNIVLINGIEYVSVEDAKEAIHMALEENGIITIGDDSIMQEFEKFRKAYKGTKRGLITEFNNFKKKHKDYAKVAISLYDLYNIQEIRREAMKKRGDWLPMLPNMQTYINQRRWEEAEFQIDSSYSSNEKHYDSESFGIGVYTLNGKKYYGNGIEIPFNSPKRPSIQYTFNKQTNSWFIM